MPVDALLREHFSVPVGDILRVQKALSLEITPAQLLG